MKLESSVALLSLPAEQYHRHPAVGRSALSRLLRSPAHYVEYLARPPEPTPAMQFGSAFHAALLEPERYEQDYVVAPRFDRRSKDGRSAAAAWDTANADRIALTSEQRSAIQAMACAVWTHRGAAGLLSVGHAELSGFWRDPDTGIDCKCRPDFAAMEGDTVISLVDVKSCADASADGFAQATAIFGYDLQAAFYQEGLKRLTGRTIPFYFIAVEKTPPHAVAVYRASETLIEIGRSKARGALQLLQWCRERDQWPGYQPHGEIETFDLPRWAARFALES